MLKNNVPGYINSDGNLNTVYISCLNQNGSYIFVCIQRVSRKKWQQKTRAVRNNEERKGSTNMYGDFVRTQPAEQNQTCLYISY